MKILILDNDIGIIVILILILEHILYSISHCIILYCMIVYIMLYYNLLYCTILYYTIILFCMMNVKNITN